MCHGGLGAGETVIAGKAECLERGRAMCAGEKVLY